MTGWDNPAHPRKILALKRLGKVSSQGPKCWSGCLRNLHAVGPPSIPKEHRDGLQESEGIRENPGDPSAPPGPGAAATPVPGWSSGCCYTSSFSFPWILPFSLFFHSFRIQSLCTRPHPGFFFVCLFPLELKGEIPAFQVGLSPDFPVPAVPRCPAGHQVLPRSSGGALCREGSPPRVH